MNLHVSTQRATDDLLTRANLRLRIGDHVIDVGALRMVTRPELPRLTSKAVAVLIELVRHVGTTVTRDQLLDRVWTGRFPTPDVLTQAIKELRRAFADDSKPPHYIETIPKVGYRLIAPVLVLDGPDGGIFVESGAAQEMDADLSGDTAEPESAHAAKGPHASRSRKWLAGGIAIAAACLALAVVFVRERAPASASSETPTWSAVGTRALTSDPGPELRPHISPDGSRIAFGVIDPATQLDRIVVRSIEPSPLVRLTASGMNQHEAQPMWSPDGMRLAYERLGEVECTMYVALSLGGDEREIGACKDYNVNYFDWTPDGHGLITAQQETGDSGELALMTLNLDTGGKQFLKYDRAADDQDLEPHFSPDGRWIAFRRGIAPYSDLYVTSAEGGTVRQVTHISSRIRGHTWSRDGTALIFASNFAGPMSLYAVDVETGKTQALDVSPAEYPNGAAGTDSVVYEVPRTQNTLALVPIGNDSAPQLLAPSTGSDYAGTLSPAADRIVFVSDRSGQYQLWLYDWAREGAAPLTERADTAVFGPHWSGDGKRILAVQHNAAEGRRLLEIDVATRRQRVLSNPGENVLFGMYGPEPDSLLVTIGSSGKDNKLYYIEHAGTPQETRKVLESGVAYAQLDEKARALYYTPSAGRGLFRFDFATGEDRFITPKVNAISMNAWRVIDGHIWWMTGAALKRSNVHELDPATGEERIVGQVDAGFQDLAFSVMPDRKSLIATPVGTQDTDIGMFRLTRNETH
ncbi:MAG: winged helix-turn-helix domain-containing protein [Rhodanobacteraceae bacterium]